MFLGNILPPCVFLGSVSSHAVAYRYYCVLFAHRELTMLFCLSLQGDEDDENARPLAESLLLAVTDLLFCPDFTVQSHRRSTVVS